MVYPEIMVNQNLLVSQHSKITFNNIDTSESFMIIIQLKMINAYNSVNKHRHYWSVLSNLGRTYQRDKSNG